MAKTTWEPIVKFMTPLCIICIKKIYYISPVFILVILYILFLAFSALLDRAVKSDRKAEGEKGEDMQQRTAHP